MGEWEQGRIGQLWGEGRVVGSSGEVDWGDSSSLPVCTCVQTAGWRLVQAILIEGPGGPF